MSQEVADALAGLIGVLVAIPLYRLYTKLRKHQ